MKPNSNAGAAAQGANTQDKKPNFKVVTTEKELVPQLPQQPSIEELKNVAAMMVVLSEKHSTLLEKKRSLELFAISHDNKNAKITVIDANGKEFHSSSPKTVENLIVFWKEEFSEAIAETENKLREMAKTA